MPNKDRELVDLEAQHRKHQPLRNQYRIANESARTKGRELQVQRMCGDNIGVPATIKLSSAYRFANMRQFAIGVIILQASLRISGLYTIVECPMELRRDVAEYSEPKPLRVSCTMQLLCPPLSEDLPNYENRGYQVHEYDPDARAMCEVKLRINVVRNLSAIETDGESPCVGLAHHEHPVLLPHSTNCSLFYKCDWGVPMLFECPEELHFNHVLQVCDWPWQAGCDSPTWDGCPRPFPRCPIRYPGPLLLPHPFLCDRFYQCNWGRPRLQACPTGLYFDPRLKVCDWSYNSNCRNC